MIEALGQELTLPLWLVLVLLAYSERRIGRLVARARQIREQGATQ
jgi:hypothetical protein